MAADITALEKKAGQKAARKLRIDLRKVLIASAITPSTPSEMISAVGASVHMKYGQLDHIALKATKATFMQHYGFEGIKSNGVRMRMQAFDHFTNLFNTTPALEVLMDEIGAARAEEIMNNIRF